MASTTILSIILILLLAGVSAAWIDNTGVSPSEVSSLQNQVNTLQNNLKSVNSSINGYWNKKIDPLQSSVQRLNSSVNAYWKSLPLMNQTPTSRDIWVQWEKTQSGQDRFNPSMVIVNQGDTVHLTFISNDTVTHTFTMGSPYNFQINASMPGLYNDLTGREFTTPALHNSLGVKVFGRPGNVTATGTFVARYAGIYEFVCTYHVQVGMFGYLIVLPNAAYEGSSSTAILGQYSAGAEFTAPESSAIASATQLPAYVTKVSSNNTLIFNSNDLRITALATMAGMVGKFGASASSVPSYVKPNGPVFVIYGMVDPTLVIPGGAKVNVTFINMDDDMVHGFHVTETSPPYPTTIDSSTLLDNMKDVGPTTNGTAHGYSFSFAAGAGTYWYVCDVPGHAAAGMYGKMIVGPQTKTTTTTTTTTSATAQHGGSAVQVSIVNGAYNPNASQTYVPDTTTIVIGVNNTVSWTNNDAAPHTVTSDSGLFNSGNMNPGESWTYTFTTPGTYSYHCDYHPWMKGVVVVKGG